MSLDNITQFLERARQATLLRFSTAGSVDDGKSTLIGRLLHDSKNIFEDQIESLKKRSQRRGAAGLELALVTDGLKAEQEQGITIDVAYRYFSTPKRRFILADTPGHEQYTRNMATGASTAALTIVLVDASKGILPQTKRHAFIASLMGVPRLLVAVNKMDLVQYEEKVFEQHRADFIKFAERLGVKELKFIPVSALEGDNVVEPSTKMSWYHGETIIEYLENVYVQADENLVDFRLPIQSIINPHAAFRGFAGKISSGILKSGDEVIALPSMKKSRVKGIHLLGKGTELRNLEEAFPGQSVVVTLHDQLDVGRGSMLVRPGNLPNIQNQFEAMVVWMSDHELDPKKQYLIKHTASDSKVFINEIRYRVDVNTLSRLEAAPLHLNEIGRITFTATQPLFLDSYRNNRATGNFILVEPDTFLTVAAGMVIDRLPQEFLDEPPVEGGKNPKSKNLHLEQSLIGRQEREKKFGHIAKTYWFTGLSGSGKSTVAKALEKELFDRGAPIYRLDGDNLRGGLNRDLGFSAKDRGENIRRVAEVARLFNEAGVSVICSFISPFRADREDAKKIISSDSFIEIYLETPLALCEERDPHNLYRKARAGEIKDFTGISSPYEVPLKPDLVLDTSKLSVAESVKVILSSR